MSLNNGGLYPISLAQNELKSHRNVINEYNQELSFNLHSIAQLYKPDLGLIKSQPELTLDLRAPLFDFLYKVCKRTKLAPGIYYDAIKLFDRYCSKRVVLKSQAQLVGCTCIWIAAKNEGGCNHIVNSVNKPISNRFQGPTQRSRIPRVIEFVQLCGPSCGYDEGMFIQMERHILNTLEWSVSSISVYNWCFNIHEIQTMTEASDSPSLFDFKKLFYIKNFLIELSLYSSYFIMQDPAELAMLIKKLLSILILNEESHFSISKSNLQKILEDNKIDGLSNEYYQHDDVFKSSKFDDNLQFYTQPSDNNEVNRLIYSIATVSNTIYQHYTTTEYPEINEIIHKIHKVSVSHIMALKEEEREIKRQELQNHFKQQQQEKMYLNLCNSSSSVTQSNYESGRSPGSYSVSSSTSDYEDSYSTFSRKESTTSSVISSPLPSPGEYPQKVVTAASTTNSRTSFRI